MPKVTCTLVGIISLPVEPGNSTSQTDYLRNDDLRLADTLARLVGKTPVTADRLSSMRRLSAHARSSPMSRPPRPAVMVRANVERLEAQLYEQAEAALEVIETARV